MFSCSETNQTVVINGQLNNLPDGKMHLFMRDSRTGVILPIDSTDTHEGNFSFSLSRRVYPEPYKVHLVHLQSQTNQKRIFTFLTNLRYRGSSLSLDYFMLEDGIRINGIVQPVTFRNFNSNSNVIPCDIDRPISYGPQTSVAYNDTAGFSELTNVNQVKQLIQTHPYSYYYLYAIKQRAPGLSDKTLKTLLACFKPEVQASQTGQQLLTYIRERKEKKLTFKTVLPNQNGQMQPILRQDAPYNLVILWASWCGPCRMKIPQLKQFYGQIRPLKRVRLVSVSLDQQRSAWVKALINEQMPWEQLILDSTTATYVKELFQFDGAIPCMLLIDRQGKIVRKITGYNEEAEQEMFDELKTLINRNPS